MGSLACTATFRSECSMFALWPAKRNAYRPYHPRALANRALVSRSAPHQQRLRLVHKNSHAVLSTCERDRRYGCHGWAPGPSLASLVGTHGSPRPVRRQDGSSYGSLHAHRDSAPPLIFNFLCFGNTRGSSRKPLTVRPSGPRSAAAYLKRQGAR